MCKKLLKILIALLICINTTAQKNKIHFYSINSFGLIGGESEVSTAFQTVNGIHFSNWFSGIGIGVDNYKYKTLPLFFDGRWFFGDDKRGFIYGDLGYNFPLKDKPGKEIPYYSTYHFTGGIYTDLGIGYKFPLYKKTFMLFSLGYSYKKVRTNIGVNRVTIPCPLMSGPCNVGYNSSKYDFNFNRIILKAGLVF